MSILQGLKGYYSAFGVRGVLAISAHRLAGRPKELKVQPSGIRYPVHIRVRTSDLSVYNEILLQQEYAFDLPSLPKTIVDAGANIGMASLFYAHKYPAARIIAVEAEASNYALLVKNVANYPNIFPIHAALWNRDGEIGIGQPGSAFGKWGFVTREGGAVRVRAVTMQTLMAEMNIDSIDLLKVDIEGAEKEVFEDCDWMQHVGSMIIELHDRSNPGCSAAVSSVTREFSSSQRGEMTLYKRRHGNALGSG